MKKDRTFPNASLSVDPLEEGIEAAIDGQNRGLRVPVREGPRNGVGLATQLETNQRGTDDFTNKTCIPESKSRVHVRLWKSHSFSFSPLITRWMS